MKQFEVKFTGFEVRQPLYYGSTHVCFFTTQQDAQKCVKSIGAGEVREYNINSTWTVYDTFDEYENDPVRKEQRKAAVLAKLTTEEKELLGLL